MIQRDDWKSLGNGCYRALVDTEAFGIHFLRGEVMYFLERSENLAFGHPVKGPTATEREVTLSQPHTFIIGKAK